MEWTSNIAASLVPLLSVTAAACLCEYLLPGGSSSRLVKSLRLVTGLCVLLALAAPLRGALGLMRELKDGGLSDLWSSSEDADDVKGENYLNEYLTLQTREAVEEWAKEVLNKQFGISSDCCRVVVTMGRDTETDLPYVSRVDVVLSGNAILRNPHLIEEWFENETGGICRVTVE